LVGFFLKIFYDFLPTAYTIDVMSSTSWYYIITEISSQERDIAILAFREGFNLASFKKSQDNRRRKKVENSAYVKDKKSRIFCHLSM